MHFFVVEYIKDCTIDLNSQLNAVKKEKAELDSQIIAAKKEKEESGLQSDDQIKYKLLLFIVIILLQTPSILGNSGKQ